MTPSEKLNPKAKQTRNEMIRLKRVRIMLGENLRKKIDWSGKTIRSFLKIKIRTFLLGKVLNLLDSIHIGLSVRVVLILFLSAIVATRYP